MSAFEFSTRPIGIELEIPEYADELERMEEDYDWQIKDDGSIPDDGREFVSPPIHGDQILRQITRFYKLCRESSVSTEHTTCGTHVHINAVDIYKYINECADPDAADLRVDDWGMAISALSRLFVGSQRNGTRFARGGFAIRGSYPCTPGALKKSRREEYPTLAIRENTFEFRIFPSTTAVNYTLARAMFCQAAGDWIFRNLKVTDRTFKNRLAKLTAPIEKAVVFQKPELLEAALKELRVGDAATTILMEIFNKFKARNEDNVPTLWDREREQIITQSRARKMLLQAMQSTMERFNTHISLRRMLRSQFGEVFEGVPEDDTVIDVEEEELTVARPLPRPGRFRSSAFMAQSISADEISAYTPRNGSVHEAVARMAAMGSFTEIYWDASAARILQDLTEEIPEEEP